MSSSDFILDNNFSNGVELIHDTLYGKWNLKKSEIQHWVGANGIGKSNFLKYIRDNEVKTLKHLKSSYCMQSSLHVLGDFTPADLVGSVKEYFKGKIREDSEELIQKLNFSDKLNRPIRYLSGGENQTLKLISSLIIESDIYFFDEATTHLDEEKIKVLFEWFEKLATEGKSIALIEHHPYAQKIAHRTLFFKKRQQLELEYGI